MRGVCLGTLIFLVIGTVGVAGQELTTVAIPSADEVYEALAQGDIDYEQYVALLEFIDATGAMKKSVFRSDLPNLDGSFPYGGRGDLNLPTDRPRRASGTADRRDSKGLLKYQYYTTFTSSPMDRYAARGEYTFARSWLVAGQIKRDQNGRERFTSRRVTYQVDSGFVRELEVGNFVETYGLGTIIGSRNKVLRYDGSLSTESLLFPDCSGFNGISVTTKSHSNEVSSLMSYNRDTSIELMTWAAMIHHEAVLWSKAIIVGLNLVNDRRAGVREYDMKAGLNVTHSTKASQWGVEYCLQSGKQTVPDNIVLEGRVRSERVSIQYSAWHYGRHFFDMTSGSKAAPIRHMEELPISGFAYADKRAGQTGLQVQSKKLIIGWLAIGGDFLIGARNSDSSYVQFRPSVTLGNASGWSARVDYLQTRQSKRVGAEHQTSIRGRAEIETRKQSSTTDLRVILAHTTTTSTGDFVSILASFRHDFGSGRQCEVWSNIGRLVHGKIDYWYGYVRTSQPLWDKIELGVKIIHRFRAISTPKHETAANLELTARL
jgi:hypothetical protein